VPRNVVLFLYGTPNIVGSLLGLLGLGLLFGGVIKQYWLFIVVGLYVAGLLLTPRSRAVELTVQSQLSAENVRDALEDLVRKIRPKVPKEILTKVERITLAILTLLPKMGDVNSGDPTIYTVRQTALAYLPEALQHYLSLPAAYANFHPVHDGKTAKTLLLEQLDLLATTMDQVVEDFHRQDTDKLLIHGRFLAERFRKTDLLA
jgi:hypothetical protein